MAAFATLWHNHPQITGEKPVLDLTVYPDQCAINLSAALIRSGVDISGFHGTWSWQKDKPKYPIRAQELANWFVKGGAGLRKTEKFAGLEAVGKVEGKPGMTGRTGIVFFQHYWGPGQQGNHIDLWNGTRLTGISSWARINLRIGNAGLHNLGFGSDYTKAQSVWFWAVA